LDILEKSPQTKLSFHAPYIEKPLDQYSHPIAGIHQSKSGKEQRGEFKNKTTRSKMYSGK